jgi:hypothetical protein
MPRLPVPQDFFGTETYYKLKRQWDEEDAIQQRRSQDAARIEEGHSSDEDEILSFVERLRRREPARRRELAQQEPEELDEEEDSEEEDSEEEEEQELEEEEEQELEEEQLEFAEEQMDVEQDTRSEIEYITIDQLLKKTKMELKVRRSV